MDTDELWLTFAFMAGFTVTHLVMKKAKILPQIIIVDDVDDEYFKLHDGACQGTSKLLLGTDF